MKTSDDPKSPLHKHNMIAFIALGLFCIGYYLYIKANHREQLNLLDQIPKFASVVNGRIDQLDLLTGRRAALYSYRVDGSRYEGRFGRAMPCGDKKWDMAGRDLLKQWPLKVVVSREDPSFSYALLSPEAYARAGIEYPEALRALYDEYVECD